MLSRWPALCCASRLTNQDVAAIAARHRSRRPRLDPALGRAVTGEPDEQPMAIDGTNGDTPRDDPAATLWATLEGA
jgi:hypothetical protein